MAGDGGASSGERSAWKAASIVFRIAAVALSLASAIMTATSTQCMYREDGSPDGTVSYSDYGSLKYSALANLPTAEIQGVAIYLEVAGRQNAAKTVELIDKLVLDLTSTSAPLLFAINDITSCGPPRAGRSRGPLRPRGCTKKRHMASFVNPGNVSLGRRRQVYHESREDRRRSTSVDNTAATISDVATATITDAAAVSATLTAVTATNAPISATTFTIATITSTTAAVATVVQASCNRDRRLYPHVRCI